MSDSDDATWVVGSEATPLRTGRTHSLRVPRIVPTIPERAIPSDAGPERGPNFLFRVALADSERPPEVFLGGVAVPETHRSHSSGWLYFALDGACDRVVRGLIVPSDDSEPLGVIIHSCASVGASLDSLAAQIDNASRVIRAMEEANGTDTQEKRDYHGWVRRSTTHRTVLALEFVQLLIQNDDDERLFADRAPRLLETSRGR